MPKSRLRQALAYMWQKIFKQIGLEPLTFDSKVGWRTTMPKELACLRKKSGLYIITFYSDGMTSCFSFRVSQNSPIDKAAKFVLS